MNHEQLVRDLRQRLEAFARATAAERQRLAALRKAPGERITGELAKYAGLRELLAALDGLGQRPDADKTTLYDRIRQQAAQRQQPAEGPSLDERLRRR